MIFDPVKARKISEHETLLRLRKTDFDETSPMVNVAIMQLGPVIRLWLVGLSDETREILPTLCSWIERAIDIKEIFGESPKFHQMNLHRAAAICNWLISGGNDEYHWNQA